MPPAAPRPSGTVLVVAVLAANRRRLEQLLVPEDYAVLTARDGREGLEAVVRDRPDVILIAVGTRKDDGFELCRTLKSDPATRLTPVVLMTDAADAADRIRAIEAGADDLLATPIDPVALKARVHSLTRLKRFTDDLDSAEEVMRSLALTIEARDPYTKDHCQRLATYAQVLGRRLDLPEDDLVALKRGGYFHDIGKIAIPDAILLKPDRLTADEYELMKRHAVIGDQLCGTLRVLHRAQPIVRHHHEHLDGSGYPDGLSGDAVPLLAQIMGIVDVYDAITTARPYKVALPLDAACGELVEEARRGWRSGTLVEAFVAAACDGQLTPPAN